jgi:transcriptional regulator with XRE-family HTH domain
MRKSQQERLAVVTSERIAAIGARLRALRVAKGLTLSAAAERTGLSPSMLSLLERGRTGPSIGTLVAICSVLGVEMSELLGPSEASPAETVSRFASRPAITTADGVQHRILKADRLRGIEIVIDEYSPGSASAPHPLVHDGYEFGIALDNGLEVTVNGEVHRLAVGDLVAYHSSEPHRVANPGRRHVSALWVLVRKA